MNFLRKIEEKYLISPKILYLFVNLQYYKLHQFRPYLAREKFKVSPGDLGTFSGAIMFISFFTNILFGNISDKFRCHKSMLIVLTIITTAFVFLLFIPGLDKIKGFNLPFWSILLLYLCFNNPIQPLLDKIIIDYLSETPSIDPKLYGKQRMWGTLAYGMATYIVEWMLLEGRKEKYNYNNLLYYALITTVISLACIIPLVKSKKNSDTLSKPIKGDISQDELESRIARNSNISEILLNWEYMFFIGIIFFNAVTRSGMSHYMSIFQREVLHLKPYNLPSSWPNWLKDLVGIINNRPVSTLTIFGITFEMLFMFCSGSILKKFGLFLPLLAAQLVALSRFIAYYVIDYKSDHVYAYSCLFELVKGSYFGLAHMSAIQIATKLAPPYLRATSQMVYQGTFNALGALFSGYFFGRMFNSKLKAGNDCLDDAFRNFFILNAAIASLTILAYVYKYGIKDRVFFNREAEERKLKMAELRI